MPFDVNTLPGGGALIVTGLIYAGVSAFVTGPVIGQRVIIKSGWAEQCKISLQAQISTKEPAPTFPPTIGCKSLFGWYGDQGAAFCRRYGDRFKLPFMDQLAAHQRRLKQARERRLTMAASSAPTRCACAASLTLEKQRVSFAIYAGSIRLITPTPIKNLRAALTSALHSPLCAQKD